MQVFAPVIKDRRLSLNNVALYGDKKAKSDLSISLIRYGYADGLFRTEVPGQFNNRCMDITAVITKSNKKWLPVLCDADETAKKYRTISYEILTKSAFRAEKIYLN